MKYKIFYLAILISTISCNTKKDITPQSLPQLTYALSKSPITLNATNVKVAVDLAYDNHSHTVFDIFMPTVDKPAPLVIYIHGGGFTHGEKERVYDRHADKINALLDAGIAFATIGYRFLQHSDAGVMRSLEDSKRALQFIRHYAQSFNIDKTRVASFGESAGAGTSLWLGLSDDLSNTAADNPYSKESTRLTAVGALETQGTYDILRWEEVFASYNIDMSRIPKPMMNELAKFYGATDASVLDNPDYIKYRSSIDFLKLMSPDDPPIYIKNQGKDGPPFFTDIQHHPLHAKILKEYADQKGVKSIVNAPHIGLEDKSDMNVVDFLIHHLK